MIEAANPPEGLPPTPGDAYGPPRQRLVWVLGQQPSATTLAVLESLMTVPLTDAERVMAAHAWDRQGAATTAYATAAKVAATVATNGSSDRRDLAEAELALALRRTDGEMAYELHCGRRLDMPVAFGLLRSADCTPRHVQALLDLTADLLPEDAAQVDALVSSRAATMTVSGFRRVVRKTVAKVDSRPADERTKARRRRVGVKLYPQPDGLVTIAATMPAADGIAAAAELNRRADAARTPDDPRSHGERQVDALTDALGLSGTPKPDAGAYAAGTGDTAGTAADTAGTCPAASDRPRPVAPSRRTEVQVVITWDTLLGLANNPADLLGYGPISADDVRAMLTQPGTVLRRMVTDPVTEVLVDYGRTRYRPDDYLTRLSKARDVTCRYPGCTRNAIWCDDEHCTVYPHGTTSAGNVCQLCRRHHRRKTFDGFSYKRPEPSTGRTVWSTPLGFAYEQHPASYDESGPDPGDTVPLGLSDRDPPF